MSSCSRRHNPNQEVAQGRMSTVTPCQLASIAEAAVPAVDIAGDGHIRSADEGGVGWEAQLLLQGVNLGQSIFHVGHTQALTAVTGTGGKKCLSARFRSSPRSSIDLFPELEALLIAWGTDLSGLLGVVSPKQSFTAPSSRLA
jgi:hypothetical protein